MRQLPPSPVGKYIGASSWERGLLGKMPKADNPLDSIVGEQLSAVTFVMDYVQLSFDGNLLTAITRPVVVADGVSVGWGQSGYRDALCERITRIVRATMIIENEELCVEFDDNSIVMVSLRRKDLRGVSAEAATFQHGGQLWVW